MRGAPAAKRRARPRCRATTPRRASAARHEVDCRVDNLLFRGGDRRVLEVAGAEVAGGVEARGAPQVRAVEGAAGEQYAGEVGLAEVCPERIGTGHVDALEAGFREV